MNQMSDHSSMKDRLLAQAGNSDRPTITYFTTRAVLFYISAAITIFSLFQNWLVIDLDLGYFQMESILGTVNPFRIPGALGNVKEMLSAYSMFLPDGLMNGLSIAQTFGYLLLLLAAGSVACYVYSAFLRIKENDTCARFGRIAALLAVLTVVCFTVLITVGIESVMKVTGYSGASVLVLKKVFSGPALVSLIGAAISAYCAVMNAEFKENVVIYHDGKLRIDRGEKWRCKNCGKKNLSLLERCYYCGTEKDI